MAGIGDQPRRELLIEHRHRRRVDDTSASGPVDEAFGEPTRGSGSWAHRHTDGNRDQRVLVVHAAGVDLLEEHVNPFVLSESGVKTIEIAAGESSQRQLRVDPTDVGEHHSHRQVHDDTRRNSRGGRRTGAALGHTLKWGFGDQSRRRRCTCKSRPGG